VTVEPSGDGLSVASRPAPRLVVVGAIDTAEALCRGAKSLGWTAIVVDPRARWATAERVPSADEIVVDWPDEALTRLAPDEGTAVVVLAHEDRIDLPALRLALASDAFFVGAIGSRKTQARRRDALLELGLDEGAIERIHGPVGLDVGAESPAETAVAILAEILAVRAGRDGGPLRERTDRIHA
jgi:xanthine dehydrogenase accessory factor